MLPTTLPHAPPARSPAKTSTSSSSSSSLAATQPKTPLPRLSADVRWVEAEDFLVILHRHSGRYFTLNAVGAAVFHALAEGSDLDTLGTTIARRYDVPLERCREDIAEMLAHLLATGIAVNAPQSETTTRRRGLGEARVERWIERWRAVPTAGRKGSGPAGWGRLARTLATVARVDIAMRTGGLPRLLDMLAAHPPREPEIEPERAWHLIDAARRATAFYVRKSWCLQRSMVVASTLRRHGVPAQVVIGVVPIPFAAHAWVELGGHLVNDLPSNVSAYAEIDRF